MDMKKDEILYQAVAGNGKTGVSQEMDMTLTEADTELEKVLRTEATVTVNSTEVQKDKVMVQGIVHCFVLCQNADGDVKRLSGEQAFTEAVDVKGCDTDCIAITDTAVQKADARIVNGRKVSARVHADIAVCSYKEERQELVTEIEEQGIEQKRQPLSFMQSCGAHQKRFEIREQVEIANENPSVYEILRVDGKISTDGYRIVNNKVVVKADLNVVILYVNDENYQLCTASLCIPFTEIFEVDGIEEDWLFLQNIAVESIQFESEADTKGEMRVLNINCMANATAKMFKPQTIAVLNDCYGVRQNVEKVTDRFSVFRHAGDLSGQTGFKGQIELGEMPKVGQVFYLSAEPEVKHTTVENGMCDIQGTVKVQVHYITEDAKLPLAVLEKEIPFAERFSCSAENAKPELLVQASGISYTLNGDYVIDIRGNLVFTGVLLSEEPVQAVRAVSVTEAENKKDLPSVTICFAKDGEGLWDVAKRYSTSVQSIMDANGIHENTSLSGRQLIVPKYK
ncbi:MAG: DUF3794 domain-containing protein [Clostridia bacterium]|nr:DUF3794 domain-containing protein [Clostridia bacterium]